MAECTELKGLVASAMSERIRSEQKRRALKKRLREVKSALQAEKELRRHLQRALGVVKPKLEVEERELGEPDTSDESPHLTAIEGKKEPGGIDYPIRSYSTDSTEVID